MEVKKGKLINLKTKGELAFSINPTDYVISHSFDFAVEPRLGQPSAAVSYRTGGPARLSFAIQFDKDADEKAALPKVESFLKSLGAIEEATRSIPKVEFRMGETIFKGYSKSYRYTASRFDNKGEVSSARLEMEILSDGTYESEGG